MKEKTMIAAAQRVGSAFIECFLPQFCVLCQVKIPSSEKLCPRCSASIQPEGIVFCPVCRFKGEEGLEGSHCERHSFVNARAALPAEERILTLVHRLKYSRERELAPVLAQLILRSGIVDRGLEDFHLMCPVPLFGTRERERGFNQSTEIARHLETFLGIPLIADLLAKVQPTREQAKLPAKLRRRNLLGSFIVTKPSVVARKSIILVDDVVTTGSTVVACVEALVGSQANCVLVIALAA